MKQKEPPFSIQLDNSTLTNTDRCIGMQLADRFATNFALPKDRNIMYALCLAFSNGVSYARELAKMTPKQRAELDEYYKPLAMELFYDNDTTPQTHYEA